MNSSAICSLLFTLVLVLIHHAPMHAEAKKGKGGKTLVTGLCKGFLENRANCMTVLGSDPNVLKAKNVLQLAQAILPIAATKGLEAQKFLKELAASTNSAAIDVCAVKYGQVAFTFNSVLDTVSKKNSDLKDDVTTATYDAAVTIDLLNECNWGLETAHIVNPAISALSSEMKLLCQIASSVTNLYEGYLGGI